MSRRGSEDYEYCKAQEDSGISDRQEIIVNFWKEKIQHLQYTMPTGIKELTITITEYKEDAGVKIQNN
jgi:hypothetical protein